MSTLVLLGVADESTAHDGFTTVHHLHAVALLTLQGLAVLTTDDSGSTSVVETPPEQVGVERVDVSPAFATILDTLTGDTAEALGTLTSETLENLRYILRAGRSAVVYLAENIADGEVGRQLEFLNAERLSLTVSPEDIDGLTPTK